jgi:hypothetical protein
MNSVFKKSRSAPLSWGSLYLITFISAYLLIFMEWLFILTKPSFMSPLRFFQKMEILLFASSLLTGFCFFSLVPLFLLHFLNFFRKYQNVLIKLGAILPTFLISSLALLLIDNFTYTIFEFGIVSAKGIPRGLYALLFVFIFISFYRRNLQFISSIDKQTRNQTVRKWVVVGLSVVVLISIIIPLSGQDKVSGIVTSSAEGQDRDTLPNILLITPDGVNANNMSLYGYERDTTPFLQSIANTSLIAENAFTNSANTGGSITSVFTGKYPANTRVFFPPDILRGEDAYEHLPAILHSRGYKTIQLGFPTYVDAYTFNLLSGFDEVNGRVFLNSGYLLTLNDYLPDDSAYFIYEAGNRLIDRLLHIFLIRQMKNPFAQVTEFAEDFNDSIKLEKLFELINHSDQPLFVHIHWMGTHGAKFFPDQQVFSLGKDEELQNPWDVDFYDDSILELDQAIETIFEKLTQENVLKRTIIIVGSDHGQQFFTNERIPLIFHFPEGQFSGRIEENVQNLDIAPTILDYLGIDQPVWMSGHSLLDADLSQRPIIAVGVGNTAFEDGYLIPETLEPPFYQIGYVYAVYCNKWYKLDLSNNQWESGKVKGYSTPCLDEKSVTDEMILTWMINHLKDNDFDASTLEDNFTSIIN